MVALNSCLSAVCLLQVSRHWKGKKSKWQEEKEQFEKTAVQVVTQKVHTIFHILSERKCQSFPFK